jgi:hypothetical protein
MDTTDQKKLQLAYEELCVEMGKARGDMVGLVATYGPDIMTMARDKWLLDNGRDLYGNRVNVQ